LQIWGLPRWLTPRLAGVGCAKSGVGDGRLPVAARW